MRNSQDKVEFKEMTLSLSLAISIYFTLLFATQLCPNRSQDLDISLNDVDQTNP